MTRAILALAGALLLASCGSLGCSGSSNNQAAGGGCGTHVTFLH
jgi:hypothetical protein